MKLTQSDLNITKNIVQNQKKTVQNIPEFEEHLKTLKVLKSEILKMKITLTALQNQLNLPLDNETLQTQLSNQIEKEQKLTQKLSELQDKKLKGQQQQLQETEKTIRSLESELEQLKTYFKKIEPEWKHFQQTQEKIRRQAETISVQKKSSRQTENQIVQTQNSFCQQLGKHTELMHQKERLKNELHQAKNQLGLTLLDLLGKMKNHYTPSDQENQTTWQYLHPLHIALEKEFGQAFIYGEFAIDALFRLLDPNQHLPSKISCHEPEILIDYMCSEQNNIKQRLENILKNLAQDLVCQYSVFKPNSDQNTYILRIHNAYQSGFPLDVYLKFANIGLNLPEEDADELYRLRKYWFSSGALLNFSTALIGSDGKLIDLLYLTRPDFLQKTLRLVTDKFDPENSRPNIQNTLKENIWILFHAALLTANYGLKPDAHYQKALNDFIKSPEASQQISDYWKKNALSLMRKLFSSGQTLAVLSQLQQDGLLEHITPKLSEQIKNHPDSPFIKFICHQIDYRDKVREEYQKLQDETNAISFAYAGYLARLAFAEYYLSNSRGENAMETTLCNLLSDEEQKNRTLIHRGIIVMKYLERAWNEKFHCPDRHKNNPITLFKRTPHDTFSGDRPDLNNNNRP